MTVATGILKMEAATTEQALPLAGAVGFFFGLRLFIPLLVIVRGFADTETFDLSLPVWMIALLGIAASRSEFSLGVAL